MRVSARRVNIFYSPRAILFVSPKFPILTRYFFKKSANFTFMEPVTQSRTFSSFKTAKDFETLFGFKTEQYVFTPGDEMETVPPSPILMGELKRMQIIPIVGEQAAREALIFPVLAEVALMFKDKITLFVGVNWSTNPENEEASDKITLSGVCDYLITGAPRQNEPEVPAICIVEAKKEDFEGGTWQCAAELYAAKQRNERAGFRYPFYFGCITTGREWDFIKLDFENGFLYLDRYFYALKDLPQLLGAWKWIIETQLASATR